MIEKNILSIKEDFINIFLFQTLEIAKNKSSQWLVWFLICLTIFNVTSRINPNATFSIVKITVHCPLPITN